MRWTTIDTILLAIAALASGCGNDRNLAGDAVEDQAPDTSEVIEDVMEVADDTLVDPATDEPDTTGWECVTDEDCDDSEPCTVDTCDPEGHACAHEDVEGLTIVGPRVQVTDNPEFSAFSDLVFTGSDLAVCWSDGRDGPCPDEPGPILCNYEIYCKRLSMDGEALTSDVRISDTDLPCHVTMAAWTGSDLGVAWECGSAFRGGTYFGRISADGETLMDPLEIDTHEISSGLQDLVWTGSEFVVSWQNFSDTHLARIGEDGSIIDDTILFEDASLSRMVWTGSDLAMTWRGRSSTGEYGLQVNRVSAGGALREELATLDSGFWSELAWTGSDLWVGFVVDDLSVPESSKLYLARVNASGEVTGDLDPLSEGLDDHWIWNLIWTDSEADLLWHSYGGWEARTYLTRIGTDGTRLAPDLELAWGNALAWTGETYILAGNEDVDGVQQVFLDRLGFCE